MSEVVVRATVAVGCLVALLLPLVAHVQEEGLSPVWRRLDPLPDLGVTALTFAGERFVGVGAERVAFSDDGVLWSVHDIDLSGDSYAVASNGQELAAVGWHFAASSVDGLEWAYQEIPDYKTELDDVVWAGDHWVAVGSWYGNPPGGAFVATRYPDQPWDMQWRQDLGGLSGVAWNGELLVAVGGGEIATSTDGVSWEQEVLPAGFESSALTDVLWTGQRWVAVGDEAALVSEDGHTWTASAHPGVLLRQVEWTGTDLVALASHGIFTSRDGLTWSLAGVDVGERDLTALAHGAGTTLVVGSDAVLASHDRQRWTWLSGAAFGLEWTSPAVVADRADAWVVPAAAHADGLAGTRWRSDAVLFNPGEAPAQLDLVLLERWRDNAAARPLSNTLLPGEAARLGDLVHDTFGETAVAGAALVGSSARLVVDSRTFNVVGAGTYGQQVPAVPVAQAVGPGDRVVLPGLGRDDRRRTNLGAPSLSPSPTVVHFEVHDDDGALLAALDLDLPPFGSGQLSDALAGLGEVADGYAVASSGSPDARFVPYASVVDAATGDPTFVRPTPALSGTAVIPAVAHLAGRNATFWRSDLALVNPGAGTATVRLEFVQRDQDGTGVLPSATVTIDPEHQLLLADVVGSLFGLTAAGALRLTVEQGEVVATSQTFTSTATGTFGQSVPALPDSAAVEEGQLAALVGLAESCDPSSGFRTNLGLVNLSPKPITVTVEAAYGDGTPIGSVDLDLPPAGVVQRDALLGDLGACEIRTGVALLHSDTPGARFLAYASVVDNATGDPVSVTASPVGR